MKGAVTDEGEDEDEDEDEEAANLATTNPAAAVPAALTIQRLFRLLRRQQQQADEWAMDGQTGDDAVEHRQKIVYDREMPTRPYLFENLKLAAEHLKFPVHNGSRSVRLWIQGSMSMSIRSQEMRRTANRRAHKYFLDNNYKCKLG
jgi:hypothetical protein